MDNVLANEVQYVSQEDIMFKERKLLNSNIQSTYHVHHTDHSRLLNIDSLTKVLHKDIRLEITIFFQQ